jgi:hypothetical protein
VSRGAYVASRRQAGAGNWPKCGLCRREVDAYGLDNDTGTHVTVWARCGGVRVDPSTGMSVHGFPRVHESREDFVVIRKGPNYRVLWTSRDHAWSLTDAIARLVFFHPDATREVVRDGSAEGVHAKS